MTVSVNLVKNLGRSHYLWESECTTGVLMNVQVVIMLPRRYAYTHRLMLLLATIREFFGFVLFCLQKVTVAAETHNWSMRVSDY